MNETTTAPAGPPEDWAERFEGYRPLLFSIAYRMLGSVMEAEDVVQEAWLRWQAVTPDAVRSPKAFLSTVVTRLCLDQLKSARARREQYVGPWLPEPLITSEADPRVAPDARIDAYESISMAFLVLLESLTPLERAVFLLREVFDYPYPEIAEIVGRREDGCRQLFHRAKQYLTERRPRFQPSPAAQERLTAGFVRAVEGGDLQGLMSLLAEDITLWTDGGGKVAAALQPIHGPNAVARFLLGVTQKAPPGITFDLIEVNGEPAVLFRVPAAPPIPSLGVVVLEMDEERIRAIRVVGNPEKLGHIPSKPGSSPCVGPPYD
jgi:RNA polymerase sigma-70 factor, ECF subfamily